MIFPRLSQQELKEFYEIYCAKETKPNYPKNIQTIIDCLKKLCLVSEVHYIDTDLDNVIILRKRSHKGMTELEREILPMSFKYDKMLIKQEGLTITKQGTGCGYNKWGKNNGIPMGYSISIKI